MPLPSPQQFPSKFNIVQSVTGKSTGRMGPESVKQTFKNVATETGNFKKFRTLFGQPTRLVKKKENQQQ